MNGDWTIPALLEKQAERRPDHPFLLCGDAQLSYAETAARTRRLAAGLRSLGVGAGRPVAILLDNGVPYVETWFALARLGAIEVPLNPEHRGPVLESMVRRSGADVLVCTTEHLEELARSTPAALEAFDTIILEGSAAGPNTLRAKRVHSLDELSREGGEPGPEPSPGSELGIMYTSGTTGPSKGVLVSHNYWSFLGHQQAKICGLGERDVMYCCLPLFHQGAQAACVMPMLTVGGSVALTDRFSASRWWQEIRGYGATTFVAFAAMLTILFKRSRAPDDADNPARVGIVGHVLPELQKPFEERFGVRLLNIYGMTEADCTIYPQDWDSTPPGSMGIPDAENFEVELMDENDEPVPEDAVGEICVRPRHPHIMMEGYHEMPVDTLHAYRTLWFHTGDLARRSSEGFYFFVDRLKDAIRRRGENISSSEVEQVINSHPEVGESAVVGVPSELGEDEVMAFVVARSPSLTPEELVGYAAERMAYFMIPRFVELVGELPKTQTNKIAKSELKRRGVGERTWDRARSELSDLGRRRGPADHEGARA